MRAVWVGSESHISILNMVYSKEVKRSISQDCEGESERVYGQELPKQEMPLRPGDVAGSYANADKALKLLGWVALTD